MKIQSFMKTPERIVHRQVARYLRLQYPDVIFRTDFAAGTKLTIGQAVAQKDLQHGAGYPDLFIARPSGPYHGLFIELKRDPSELYTREGKLRKDAHIAVQQQVLNRLSEQGYRAAFACGFDQARQLIDEYLGPVHSR